MTLADVTAWRDAQSEYAHQVSPLLGWLTRAREEVDLEIACAEHPGPERGIERHTVARLPGCLADLPAHVYLELLTCGAAHVYPRLDGCAQVERARALVDALALLVDATMPGHRAGRLRAMVTAPKGRKRPVMDATHVPVSRRQVLLLAGSTSRRDMPLEYRSAQERLIDAVRRLSSPDPGSNDPGRAGPLGDGAAPGHVPGAPPATSSLPAPAVTLSAPACTACGLCVRVCPDDALALADVGDAPEDAGLPAADGNDLTNPLASTQPHRRRVLRLAQKPARCTGCLACVPVCPVATLQAGGPWAASTLWSDAAVPVVDVLTRRCARCGARVPVSPGPEGTRPEVLCAQCGFRREQPFGAALPPEALEKMPPEVLEKLGYTRADGEKPG